MQRNINKNNIHINTKPKPKSGDVIKAIIKAKENSILSYYEAKLQIDEVIKRNITNNYNLMQLIYSIITAKRKSIFSYDEAKLRIEEAIKKVR